MTAEELESWLWTSRNLILTELNKDQFWWPTSNNTNDDATAWATAFLLTATTAKLGFQERLTLCKSGVSADRSATRIVDRLWTSAGGQLHSHEILVDFSVCDWESDSPIKLTAESETGSIESTGDWLTEGHNSYSWDFFKLLLVPSPIRLFFARVGAVNQDDDDPIDTLVATLVNMVSRYSNTFLRPGDELGGCLIPRAKEKAYSGATTLLWLEDDTLQQRRASDAPRVWKGKK